MTPNRRDCYRRGRCRIAVIFLHLAFPSSPSTSQLQYSDGLVLVEQAIAIEDSEGDDAALGGSEIAANTGVDCWRTRQRNGFFSFTFRPKSSFGIAKCIRSLFSIEIEAFVSHYKQVVMEIYHRLW